MKSTNITVNGGLMAFACGACLSVGLAMIEDKIHDGESAKKYLPHRIFGGGLFMLGIYIVSPSYLREIWLCLPDDKKF